MNEVHDVTLATAQPRTTGELTEDERNTLLAEIRAQPTVVKILTQLNQTGHGFELQRAFALEHLDW